MNKDKEIVMIPFVAHESAMNRMERANKKLARINIIELFIILIMFVGIMIYFYLPNEVVEENSQNISQAENSEINQNIGE